MTAPEVMAWLKIGKTFCYERVPSVRVGRSVRFRRSEVEAWLAAEQASWTPGRG